jgi:hypothetical protein
MTEKIEAFVKRASFSRVELTPEQISHVSGGPTCDSSSPGWTLDPTWKNNSADTKVSCLD